MLTRRRGPVKIDERKQKVLEAIIKDYIITAEPVGSRTIARKYQLGVSPATIRNEMSDLEDMGFIEQPHTSAGRIPSQLGYRYYVDCLMQDYDLTELEEISIKKQLLSKLDDIENLIQETGKILTQFTNYTAMVQGYTVIDGKFRHIELIPLHEMAVLLLVVNESGNVFHKILELSEPVLPSELQRISQVFCSKLKGSTFNEMRRTVLHELYDELQQQKRILELVLNLLWESTNKPENEKFYIGGIINILNQPEFRNVEKIQRLFAGIEEDKIKELLSESNEPGVVVRIGAENRFEEFQDCSIITVTYEVNGKPLGKIGLLGPTRMEYSRATSLLRYVALILSEALQDQ